MKKQALVLFAALSALSVPLFAQTTWTNSKIERYNGYDYELWNQDNKGTVSMTLTGDNGSGANAKGGTFTAQWSNTCNVLFRSGRKWGTSSTQSHTDIGQITVDFAATWSSGDDVRYLGLYGWAYFKQDKIPTKRENGSSASFSNQIEWYIIQDRGSYNPTSSSDCKSYGDAIINGISYDFKVCDRIGQPMLTGNGNFKQFFSVPKNTSSHRQSGVVDVSAHFNAWHSVGMYMDGPLYEVAMKIESYKCNNNQAQGSGSGSVTKNILTIGSTPPTNSSSSATGSGTSSSSGGSQTTSCEYQTSFCGGMTFANVQNNSTEIPSTGSCLFIGNFETIQPALNSAVSINGVENTCGNDWDNCPWNDKPATKDGGYYVYVKTGTINTYENNGWQGIVAGTKPNCGTTPIINKVPLTHFSVRASGKALLVEASSPATVEIYNLRGHKAATFNVSNTSQTVNLSLPSGVYFAKVRGASMQHIRFMLR